MTDDKTPEELQREIDAITNPHTGEAVTWHNTPELVAWVGTDIDGIMVLEKGTDPNGGKHIRCGNPIPIER